MAFPDVGDRHFRALFGLPDAHTLKRLGFAEPHMDTWEWRRPVAIYTTCAWLGMATGADYTKTAPDGRVIERKLVPQLLEQLGQD
jgi:hypothetical protein